jgi:hypothetical protein
MEQRIWILYLEYTLIAAEINHRVALASMQLELTELKTRTLSGLTIGNTYYICVHDYATGGGNFTICITTSTPIITMSTGTTTGCSFVFQDNGGTGDYTNSQNLTRTFCPSSAGQCIKAVFTSFDLEDNFDYLSVYDGNSTSAPMILGSSFTASSPGTITATSTNTSGCLTFNFSSDAFTTSSGWSANISCAICVAAPSVAVQQDCYGAETICGNEAIPGNSLGSGNFNDANQGLGNLGCLNNYGATDDGSAEHQSTWYFFSPSANGNNWNDYCAKYSNLRLRLGYLGTIYNYTLSSNWATFTMFCGSSW